MWQDRPQDDEGRWFGTAKRAICTSAITTSDNWTMPTWRVSPTVQARALLGKALADLKAARERLGQNPTNSSRPPSTRAPWERVDAHEGAAATPSAEAGEDGEPSEDEPNSDEAAKPQRQASGGNGEGKRPGRRKGAPGHSRTQQLPVDVEHTHAPECCA
jgi:transposase